MYVTACDLKKAFSFDVTLKLQTTYAFWFMCKHDIANTC